MASCSVNQLVTPVATDNCGGTVTVSNDALLPITAQGTTIVTWTFTDSEGNESTQEQEVIIEDTEDPVPDVETLEDIIGDCEEGITSLIAPTATDNCAGSVTGTTDVTLPITTPGTSEITWTFDDANGNTITQVQTLIVPELPEISQDTSLCPAAAYTFPDGSVWDGVITNQVSILESQFGCDSLVTTNVTILEAPTVSLGIEEVLGCLGQEVTVTFPDAGNFDTYTISVTGAAATDEPLVFTFDETLAAIASTQEAFVVLEATNEQGCIGTSQVPLLNNTMVNWSAGFVENNDPSIAIFNTVLPETGDSFEWNFGDGNTNASDENPTHTYVENGEYTVTLTVSNECGNDTQSSSVIIESIVTLDVLSKLIKIFPNPTNDWVHVESEGVLQIVLMNMEGKELLREELNKTNVVDLSTLRNGQYVLRLYDKSGRLLRSEKLIKRN